MFNRDKKFLSVLKKLNHYFAENITMKNEETNEMIRLLLQNNQYYKTKVLRNECIDVTNLFVLNKHNFKSYLQTKSKNLREWLNQPSLYDNQFLFKNKVTAYVIIYNQIQEKGKDIFIPVCFLLDRYTEKIFKRITVDFAKVSFSKNFASFYYKLKGICEHTFQKLNNTSRYA